MLVVMDKPIHEKHLTLLLQTNSKQFKLAITILTESNGIFNVINKKKTNSKFTVSINDDDFNTITVPPGAFEIESLNNEIKRNFIEEGYFTEANYPVTRKLTFAALGSTIEISSNIRGSQIAFIPDDSIRDFLGSKPVLLHEEYNSSDSSLEFLSVDKISFELDFAQDMIFKGRRSGIFRNFTLDVDPAYKNSERFRGGVHWYMMQSKDF